LTGVDTTMTELLKAPPDMKARGTLSTMKAPMPRY